MNAWRLVKAAGCAFAAGAVCVAASGAGAQTYDWNNAAGGVWNSTLNWNPMVIPNSLSHTATVGLAGTYTITMGGLSPTVDLLGISNLSATVGIDDGYALSVNDITNDGTIVVNWQGGGSATSLVFLAGSGTR